ncbi:MAG: flagellar protein FlaG [Gammaproteobacteria bacterium]|nr:flagellar protein FlaG [Gammaproteobacteria bacterium]
MIGSIESSVMRLVASRTPEGVAPAQKTKETEAAASQASNRFDRTLQEMMVNKSAEEKSAPAKQDINDVVRKLNEHTQKMDRTLNFSIDDASGRSVIKVTDAKSGDLIRQIPSEEILRVAQWVADMREGKGGLIEEKI